MHGKLGSFPKVPRRCQFIPSSGIKAGSSGRIPSTWSKFLLPRISLGGQRTERGREVGVPRRSGLFSRDSSVCFFLGFFSEVTEGRRQNSWAPSPAPGCPCHPGAPPGPRRCRCFLEGGNDSLPAPAEHKEGTRPRERGRSIPVCSRPRDFGIYGAGIVWQRLGIVWLLTRCQRRAGCQESLPQIPARGAALPPSFSVQFLLFFLPSFPPPLPWEVDSMQNSRSRQRKQDFPGNKQKPGGEKKNETKRQIIPKKNPATGSCRGNLGTGGLEKNSRQDLRRVAFFFFPIFFFPPSPLFPGIFGAFPRSLGGRSSPCRRRSATRGGDG